MRYSIASATEYLANEKADCTKTHALSIIKLIALKNLGVRLAGKEEGMKYLKWKLVASTIGKEAKIEAGNKQLCIGISARIEAMTHVSSKI